MKKSLLAGLVLLMTICLFAGAQDTYVLKVKVQVANVRSEPDLNAQVIGQVKMGQLFEAMNKIDAFFEISIMDSAGKAVTGYVHSGVVDVISGEEAKEETEGAVSEEREPSGMEEPLDNPAPSEKGSNRLILRAGMSMSNVSLSEALPSGLSKSSVTGFGASLGYEIGGPRFCIEIGAIYKPGGFKITGAVEETPVKLAVNGTGIGACILAKIKLMPGSTPYIFGGADAGYLLSQETVLTAAGESQKSTDMDGLNRIAYGLDIGAGYELMMKGLSLLFEARYYIGLSNQIKDPEEGAYIKPNGLTLGVGIGL